MPNTTIETSPIPWKRKGSTIFDADHRRIGRFNGENTNAIQDDENAEMVVDGVNMLAKIQEEMVEFRKRQQIASAVIKAAIELSDYIAGGTPNNPDDPRWVDKRVALERAVEIFKAAVKSESEISAVAVVAPESDPMEEPLRKGAQ